MLQFHNGNMHSKLADNTRPIAVFVRGVIPDPLFFARLSVSTNTAYLADRSKGTFKARPLKRCSS